ncbi:hypothetical protein HETIRDRAFT_427371 [Heterobasidion irregulare TC 32-1]|uniref:NADH:flavin oxidoreductase/NADH oxidase N-terminal domain-containing protein n=1 Tax=Heterobasidion irregulare (strain TC 32-1) TaxID=747525 RepID=W4KAE3_HETIT|nr:uncharacterized protein HETIRDRAFT_427371 [Heterobasidion irregulare TC 32-1]ETW82310.1 hypothetical protein HETIRDRAFT_427371 [Heterobasidion irregulare TC 32-1]
MPSSQLAQLFQPIKIGSITLQHRVVLAPLTRLRVNSRHELGVTAEEYYSQRASVPGTLLISEGTAIAPKAGGFPNIPGIWSDEQITRWKKVVEAVHAKGSFIFIQVAALGRGADYSVLKSDDLSFPYISAGDVPLKGRDHEPPRPLTVPEIKEYVQIFAKASSDAVHRAGFDGVEIHGANGYLIDQFLQTNANNRTDEYGGSVENRIRFSLEIVEAVAAVIGQEKVGFRISPWSDFQEMRMPDPIPTFSALATRLRDSYPDLAFLHVVEPRIAGGLDSTAPVDDEESNDFLREIWGTKPYLAAGGFTRDTAIETVEQKGGLVVFGRHFISNPDLPTRLLKGIPLTPYDRSTFYTPDGVKGYTDYPFAAEPLEAAKVAA